jgi:hypothetical protein
LVALAIEYYKGPFGPGEGNMFNVDHNLWRAEERVTSLENEELTKPFSEDEIKVALFQMERNKAFDPYGILPTLLGYN